MNQYVTGAVIKALREEHQMTQAAFQILCLPGMRKCHS